MLQQTQVKTVLPYFDRWLQTLPDFAALAAASEDTVLKLWEGLGYYSRARNLHKLAKAVVALPEPPRTPIAWQELPGIGPYSSAAITSISFDAQSACVDGNVVRILSRLTANGTAFRDSASAAKAFTPLANEILPETDPGTHNQAMMELGATVCFRQKPLCTICPVREFCAAGQRGDPENFPQLAAKKIERVTVARIWSEQQGNLLLHKAALGARRLAGQYELPNAGHVGLDEAKLTALVPLAKRGRAITRYQITETIYKWVPSKTERTVLEKNSELSWVPLDKLSSITLSGPHRRWITELLGDAATAR